MGRAVAGVAVACWLGFALGLEAVEKLDARRLPPASDKKGISFDTDIKPMFEKSCVKCHSGEKAKGRLQLNSRGGVLKGGESKDPAVVPGKSGESHLLFFAADLVPDMEMPPPKKRSEFPALTKDQLGILRAWIEQGAK